MNDFTIFVSSCDQYADAWHPFFSLLEKHGGSLCKRPICLCSETKTYTHHSLSIRTFQYRKNSTWSQRIKAALSTIDTEYILFIIDDYFLLDSINENTLQLVLEYLKNNKDVGYLSIPNKPMSTTTTSTEVAEKIDLTTKRLYLTVSFWKTDYMKRILRKHESIWDFERYSVLRVPLYPEKVMQLNPSYPILYHYLQPSSIKNGLDIVGEGYGIVRGRWLRSTKDLFEQHNIEVCFENMGWYQPGVVTPQSPTFLERLGKENRFIARLDRFIKKRKRKMSQRKKKRFMKKSTQ